jgi:hypothetical protein
MPELRDKPDAVGGLDPDDFRCSSRRMDHLQIANLGGFILNVFITYAGGMATLFGGKNNSQISEEYTAIITPAGWAFSIWGIIFIGEGVFTVWQSLPAQKGCHTLAAIGYWWLAACVIQSMWTFAFAYEVPLANHLHDSDASKLNHHFTLAFTNTPELHRLSGSPPFCSFPSQRPWSKSTSISMLRPPSLSPNHLRPVTPPPTPSHQCGPSHQAEASLVPQTAAVTEALTTAQWWIVVFPFSVHAGWLIAAALVNVNLCAIK